MNQSDFTYYTWIDFWNCKLSNFWPIVLFSLKYKVEIWSELSMNVGFFLLLFCILVIFWIIQFPGLGKKILGEESNEFTNDLGKYKNLNIVL